MSVKSVSHFTSTLLIQLFLEDPVIHLWIETLYHIIVFDTGELSHFIENLKLVLINPNVKLIIFICSS